MWQETYSITAADLSTLQVWKIWSDLTLRPQWDDDTEWARIEGIFQKNAKFEMKIKNGPKLTMKISECTPYQSFTDSYQFFLARLDGIHVMKETAKGLCITTTIKLTGPLSWLWKKLVGEKIVKTLPHQTDLLIQLARKIN